MPRINHLAARPARLAVVLLLAGAASSAASADLFRFDLTMRSDGLAGIDQPVVFSAIVEGTDDSSPEEPWETFALADNGPWLLESSNPFLTLTGSDLQLAYGPTFGLGGMTLEIVDLTGPDETVTLDWTLVGPEWNHDTISGTGSGVVLRPDGSGAELAIDAWSVTLVPAPGAPALLLPLAATRRRRRG